jgi:hypothetical protein
MAENKIIGYKKIFGLVLPDWVSEKVIRYVAAGLLTSVMMLLVLIFLIWPNFATVSARAAVLETNKKDLEVLRSSGQGLERIKTDLSATDQQKILAAMPTEYSPDGAIYLLRKISADTGVSIVSYSLPAGQLLGTGATQPVGSKAAEGGEMVSFIAYPVRLTIAAPVEALLSFISKVESSLPFGVVSDLNLQEVTRLSRSATDKTVQLATEIKFYQAVLKTVSINKLLPLSPENLTLAKELSAYNLLTVPEIPENTTTSISTGSGTIFGF